MRRSMMRVLAILMVVWIDLLPPPTAAQGDYVEVTFYCPHSDGLLTFEWKEKPSAQYTEAGKLHDLTFRFAGGQGLPFLHTASATRGGAGIQCRYQSAAGTRATYDYDVHREIISCQSGVSSIKCKLKP